MKVASIKARDIVLADAAAIASTRSSPSRWR